MHVVIFEGQDWRKFAPLTLSRPVFALVGGMSSLLDKARRHLCPSRLTLWVRPEMVEHCRRQIVPRLSLPVAINQPLDQEPALLVNGRTLWLEKFVPGASQGVAVGQDGLVQMALVVSPGLSPADLAQRSPRWLRLLTLPPIPCPGRFTTALWDLITWNKETLAADIGQWRASAEALSPGAGPYHLVNETDILLGQGVTLGPGCVLDASGGPVALGEKVCIGANSVIQGPCYLGPQTWVRPLSLIRPGTTTGIAVKLGGEIANAIFLNWSNKAHDGFVGDSYLGEWVNLGAGTSTSNLKNTYGPITLKIGTREIETGSRFLGSLIGDHSKTAIQTRLMTGSYVGFCCMLAGSALPPRFLPSLSFWTDRGIQPYNMDKAIEVAQRVFARREQPWMSGDEQMMHYVAQAAPEIENG